jgi:hypothetical protein
MFKTSNLKATLCNLHKVLNGERQFFKFEQKVQKSNVNQHSKSGGSTSLSNIHKAIG